MKERMKNWSRWLFAIVLACVLAIAVQALFLQADAVPQKNEQCTIFYSDEGGDPISLYCPTLGWLKAPFGPGQ